MVEATTTQTHLEFVNVYSKQLFAHPVATASQAFWGPPMSCPMQQKVLLDASFFE